MASKNIQLGLKSEGEDVKSLQKMLNSLGYEIEADGFFGKDTSKIVSFFQQKNKLKPDGIVDDKSKPLLGSYDDLKTVYPVWIPLPITLFIMSQKYDGYIRDNCDGADVYARWLIKQYKLKFRSESTKISADRKIYMGTGSIKDLFYGR